ncbi:uncharacterized protein L969DRAFT_86420 [Mixia osmundae IAM 14324]|nr:uncharacterized protein L969DRAFT_86420 [Mixia osmundae IAM 14324]KEI39834.1 hypothetical protein L969DRAFT_86420 [Mixia osmundae IAM 14324]
MLRASRTLRCVQCAPRRTLTTKVLQDGPTPGDERPSKATDPYPIPFQTREFPEPVSPASIGATSDIITPHPEGRPVDEPVETMRARLVYQSRKRGILETDLILSTFAKRRLPSMTENELKEYDRFLTLPDWDILSYATGKRAAPEGWEHSKILTEIQKHSDNEGKEIRMMPSLTKA